MKPILFNTEMVKAILDGRKTVTRRICKDANERTVPLNEFIDHQKRTYAIQCYSDKNLSQPVSLCEVPISTCKGDILYIRETWNYNPLYEYGKESEKYVYKASYDGHGGDFGWKPSIHMPKTAARIFLKVIDVSIERLQNISEEQAKHEGIRAYSKDGELYKFCVNEDWWMEFHRRYEKALNMQGTYWQDMPRTAKKAFEYLWNTTIKRADLEFYSWDINPWVWIIEFEKLSKESINEVTV